MTLYWSFYHTLMKMMRMEWNKYYTESDNGSVFHGGKNIATTRFISMHHQRGKSILRCLGKRIDNTLNNISGWDQVVSKKNI